MATEMWVNIGSSNGLLPDGIKPLPEPMLTDHQWSQVTFILGQFHKRCLNHQSLKSVGKLHRKFHSNFSGANEFTCEPWCVESFWMDKNLYFNFIVFLHNDTIGILCGYAIRSGRHPEGSQRPPQSIPFIQYVHLRCWIKNNCANCALKWEIQWLRTIYPYLYDVACQASWRHLSSEARGPKARRIVEYPKDCIWPVKSQNTNMDLFHT